MVQILLLGAMSNQQSAGYEENLDAALARERHGYRHARAKRVRERRQAQQAAPTRGTPEEETNREAGAGEAEGLSAEMRLEKIAQALENMKAAAESGGGLDAATVYKRIREIVGLTSPLVPIGEDSNAARERFGV